MTTSGTRRPDLVPPRLAGLLVAVLTFAVAARAEPKLTFEKDIRPVLKAHCFDCHGEAGERKGGLDVRLRRWLVRGGDEGPALVPGKPDESRMVLLVESGRMPKRDKKLPPADVAKLRAWIASGAETARAEPDTLPSDGAEITEEERSFWSFRPIRPSSIPPTEAGDRARTPIDAFLLATMKPRGLRFAPDAEKATLLRRLSFDLIGLPPSPEQMDAFLADTSPDAYERWVDRLLDSKHYGERWGRHWLDAAGYADSDGFSDADPPRTYAYKYRDYVIRAFNEDKPFDRFVAEQLAGDELANATRENAAGVALSGTEARELLVATGFLRMCADGSATDALTDRDAVRNQVVADTLKIVTRSLLGLSVGCAQCHDHRYDPIPQEDYYRLRAVFEPAYDYRNWRTPAERLVSLYTDADRKKAADVEAEASKLAAEREAKQKQYLAEALAKHLEKFEMPLRESLREALDTAPDKRTADQKRLIADNPSVNIHPGVLYQYNPKAAEELKAMDARVAEIRAGKPAEDFLAVLTEPANHLPETRLFHRGDYHQAKQAVPPGGLSVLAATGRADVFPSKDPSLPTSGRRLAFARWLTSGTNPLVARVLVNRIWLHHFGRGLVDTPADFGVMGERPSHPELLDWLADDFARNGWSAKRLHRLIVTSTAYRQSSRRDEEGDASDPDGLLYARKPVVRLDAEAIRDAMLSVGGVLNTKMFGPPVPVRPDVHGQIVVGEDKTTGDNKMPVETSLGGEEFRRSVYVQVRRSRPLAMLHAFDAPVMETNCDRRRNSTVATQSLMLMNSATVLDLAARFAGRVAREAGADRSARIRKAWWLAFQRTPQDSELRDARAFLEDQIAFMTADAKPAAADSKRAVPEEQALTNLCQALITANEFLYVD